jgi:hypothetical protein
MRQLPAPPPSLGRPGDLLVAALLGLLLTSLRKQALRAAAGLFR